MAFQIAPTDAAPTLARNTVTANRLAPVVNTSAMTAAAGTLERNAVTPFKSAVSFQLAMSGSTLNVLAGTVGYAN